MNLQNWVASFSGCDGGDLINSDIWVVGIEWGFGNYKRDSISTHEGNIRDYHTKDLPVDIQKGYKAPHAGHYSLKDNLDYGFGLNTAKLICNIKGVEDEPVSKAIENIPDSEVFKLNLYPIAFPNANENQWLKYDMQAVTGITSKKDYMDYCKTHRFPFFKQQAELHKPRLILCMGVSYVREFYNCFAGKNVAPALTNERFFDEAVTNKVVRNFYWVWINKYTLLVVTPFPIGPSGLNSEDLLSQFGTRIQQILKDGFVE